ncbi:glycosyltransferase family 57 protein [Gonapodya prolifera JEL478]|uniref:Alpha-1,3-glucosyltransferase n=1 Tax=Gonapodya prolifera (strain JEL478) TaxID=1344416 RepID=A0A139A1G2_GONPJ|nr:glycosyltransferase family 57 protein [Gonapodya prolifera JEL478]|eukprot:KXS10630.1 glycosyltransferase family 57 protein [Gonapodya prolifera JEL478]
MPPSRINSRDRVFLEVNRHTDFRRFAAVTNRVNEGQSFMARTSTSPPRSSGEFSSSQKSPLPTVKPDWTFIATLFGVSTAIKVLLFPAYRSTDFEVHRNWLAITYNLPLKSWYYDETSQWTLDYPPFFAFFEWILAHAIVAPAAWLTGDWRMLELFADGYDSWMTVVVHRTTVIMSEVVLLRALIKLYYSPKVLPLETTSAKRNLLLGATFLNPGFLIVDSIHFQYNGFLFGVLLWSVAEIMEGNDLLGGAIFAVLLNLKHIFLYLAPAYFIYLLRHFCFQADSTKNGTKGLRVASKALLSTFDYPNFVLLASSVLSIFCISFLPFLASTPSAPLAHLSQIISRLFPFRRGLVHAYWAPNFWALYVALDRALALAFRLLRLPIDAEAMRSATRGVVEDVRFAVLADVRPGVTVGATLLAMLPSLVHLYFSSGRSKNSSSTPSPQRPQVVFLASLVSCAFASFLLGWHVHEKAVILVTVPLLLLASIDPGYQSFVQPMNLISYYSLFPLLHRSNETLIKFTILAAYMLLTQDLFAKGAPTTAQPPLLTRLHTRAFPIVITLSEFILPLFAPAWAFAPLALTSVWCAVGLLGLWVQMTTNTVSDASKHLKNKTA